MKLYSFLLVLLFISISSCSKSEEAVTLPCEFEIVIEPVCSFNPKFAQTTAFPVRVLSEGMGLPNSEYLYSWSSDLDFGGSAISVTYEQLPLTVEVTEISTGCTVEGTLENTYWD